MDPMHPVFIDITDTESVRHLLRLERITRVTFLGTPEAPESEVWLMFGNILKFSAAETARLVRHLDMWGHILRPPSPEESGR
jgi:hypothetical protein